MKAEIKIFEERKVRTMWNEDTEEWYFSIVDVVGILTDQPTIDSARNYWKVLKHRMKAEGNETVTNCNQLKLLGQDGKMRMTDVANETQLFRLIQSIPSPKAEPFKQWMAQIAKQRFDQIQDPELSIEQAMRDNMTGIELALNILAEASATEISKAKNPKGFKQSKGIALEGAKVAKDARTSLEQRTGKSAISPLNAKELPGRKDDAKQIEE